MNRKLLSLAVASCISTLGAQAEAVTVFSNDSANLDIIGRLKIAYVNDKGGESLDTDHRLNGTARLGVEGKNKVNDIVSVYGQLLYDLRAEDNKSDDSHIDIRYGFVGFDFNDFGTLQFGRSEDAFYEVYAPVDQYEDWGLAHLGPDNDGQVDGIAMYRIDYEGFKAGISYKFKDRSAEVKYGIGGYLGYEFDFGFPVGILAGYNHTKYDDTHKDGDLPAGKREQAGATVYAGTFGEPGFYGAISYLYSKVDRSRKSNGLEVIGAYTTPGADWTFSVSYGWMGNSSKARTLDAYGSDRSKLFEGLTAQINYDITSNFQVHAEYMRVGKSVLNPDDKQDLVQFGFIYNF